MEHLFEYLVFLGKAVTIVAAIIVVIVAIASAVARQRHSDDEYLEVKPLNKRFEKLREALDENLLPSAVLKQRHKRLQKEEKAKRKAEAKAAKASGGERTEERRKHVYVVDFDGDIRASAVNQLREEVTAILQVAKATDEVVVRLESPGGMVHGYGLAASQLARIRDAGIPLVAAVDKVAASGGYMMACVANQIIAAPFAIIGSIGVVAQLPNFNKLLKQHNIDFEMITAGEHKRTLTVFGENTDADRQKMQQEINEAHDLFKGFIHQYRQQVDVDQVGTGEHWYGQQALDLQLVDRLTTSDDYLLAASKDADLYQLSFHGKKPLLEKLLGSATRIWEHVASRWQV